MKKIKLKRYSAILLSAVLLILSLSVGVFATKSTPYPTPTSNFFVNDFADCINDSDEQKMQLMAEELYEKTTAQVVCVTVNSLEGEEVRDYSLGLGREWGIGSKDNNGVLLLLSTEDRKIDIEVGYGLEGTLPDGKTGRILDEYAVPHLKNDDFSTGLREAFSALIGETAKEYGIEIEGTNYVEEVNEDKLFKECVFRIISIIFVLIIMILIIKTKFAAGKGDGNSYGGGGFSSGSGFSSGGGGFSSGGGFSGGGGSFGGGGSSRGF